MNSLDKTEEFFCAKIKNMIFTAENNHYPKFSFFLDGRQQTLAKETLLQERYSHYACFGGTTHAERVMLGVYPDYLDSNQLEWPFLILHICFHKNYPLTHRDFLGALMSLQIKREMLGDIYVEQGVAEIAVHEQIADFICENLNKVGNVGIKITRQSEFMIVTEPKFQEINGTVSSVRVDSVVSLATHLSRTKACELIVAGKVTINHRVVESLSLQLKPEDTIRIRGYGKFVLSKEMRTTKKNRYYITIYKFIS